MGAPLDVVQRKLGVEYHHESTLALAGLDLDANENTLAKERFWDLRNFRITSPGEIEVRSGIRDLFQQIDTGAEIVATCEFVVSDLKSANEKTQRLLAIFYWDGIGAVKFLLVDKSLDANASETLFTTPITVLATGITTEPIIAATQQGNSLIVSIFDYATYECYPSAGNVPVTNGGAWSVFTLGKELCPVPTQWAFESKIQADLLLYGGTVSVPGAGVDNMKPALDAITRESRILRLDIGADYWLAEPSLGLTNEENLYFGHLPSRRWVWPKSDTSGNGMASVQHPKTRANGYRFVVAYTRTDARGNIRTYYSRPSTDIWVEERIYRPATCGVLSHGREALATIVKDSDFDHDGSNYWFDQTWTDWLGDGKNSWVIGLGTDTTSNLFDVRLGKENTGDQRLFPSEDAFFALQNKFRSYFGDGTVFDAGGTGDPYYFAARYLGWHVGFGTTVMGGYDAPYKVFCSSYELKRAPCTKFYWNWFTGLPDGATEVLVFRTGHFGADDKADSNIDSLSEPHVYGKVGSIKKDGSFTDLTPDDAIDFGDTPDQYEGYEVGQFSSQVVREYMTKLALLNTKTSYWVDTPGPAVSATLIPGGSLAPNPIHANTRFAVADDGLPVLCFHFAYVDQLGTESALSDIVISPPTGWAADFVLEVDLVLPRGYDPFVTGYRVYSSYYNGGVRSYYDFGTYDVSVPLIKWPVTAFHAGPPLARPGRVVKDYYEPTYCIYSLGNQPYNIPLDNVQKLHSYSAIVGAEVILGDLVAFMQDGLTWTTLEGGTVRVEENTKEVGAISRWAFQKWNEAVFFLAQGGLYIAEGDGVRPFTGQVSTDVREYLNEHIPGQPRFANARRASIGALSHRYEIALYFPSSIDLWPEGQKHRALPQAMFIYKFMTGQILRQYGTGNFRDIENYQFDLTPDFRLTDTPPSDNGVPSPATIDLNSYRSDRVLLASQVDGTLWAAHMKAGTGALYATNCDVPLPWSAPAYAEKPFVLGAPTATKQIRMLYLKVKGQNTLTLITGVERKDFGYSMTHGHINPGCRVWPMTNPLPGRPVVLMSRGTSRALETKGIAPIVRIISEPNAITGAHDCAMQSIDLDVALKHFHPR